MPRTSTPTRRAANVVAALETGLRKVLARMGISTLASYRGGQLFDVLGLDAGLARRCFPAAGVWPGRPTRDAIGATLVARHRHAWRGEPPSLEDPGLVRFRGTGEAHAFAPRVVKATQALAAPDVETDALLDSYRQAVAEGEPRQPRDLLSIRPVGPPVPLSEVEPAAQIARRFVSSAMSLGALSPEAHQAISIGMARLGGSANSGEGGEDPAWYAPSSRWRPTRRGDQAGGLGALRRHRRVPRARRAARDQDRAGLEARRGRAAARARRRRPSSPACVAASRA